MDPQRSFEEYVRARGPALSRVAYLLTGDHHLAEDLVQHALLRVVGNWPRVIAQGDPDPYVKRILYHQHVSWWRQSRRVTPRATLPDRAEPDPADDLAEAVAVRQALRLLAPRQRAVLVLRYFEDLTEAQAAEVLGIRIGTVKSQARDGLARLRELVPGLRRLPRTEVNT